jgi:hypothetical protein
MVRDSRFIQLKMDRMRKGNLRVISFLLILIFTQKLVLGLWVHNWLHEPRSERSWVLVNNGKACPELQPVKCHCIDDALMPLIKSNPFGYQGHQRHLVAILLIARSAVFPRDEMIPALRGPPFA